MPENVVRLNLDFWFKPLNQAETVWNGQKLKAENRQLALENQEFNCRNQNLQSRGQKIEMSQVDLKNEI